MIQNYYEVSLWRFISCQCMFWNNACMLWCGFKHSCLSLHICGLLNNAVSAQMAGLLCEEEGPEADNVKYCGYCKHHYNKMVRGPAFITTSLLCTPVLYSLSLKNKNCTSIAVDCFWWNIWKTNVTNGSCLVLNFLMFTYLQQKKLRSSENANSAFSHSRGRSSSPSQDKHHHHRQRKVNTWQMYSFDIQITLASFCLLLLPH